MRHIGPLDFHHGDITYFCRVSRGNVKKDRFTVQHITVRRLHFNQRVPGAIGQSLRGDEGAVIGGIEGVDCGNLGIGELHGYQLTVGVINLESSPGVGDGLAGLRVRLDDLDIAGKRRIVDEEAVHAAILVDEHIKVFHEFAPIPALGLADGVHAVGHQLGLGVAVLIAYQVVTFGFFGIIIAAGGLEEHRKLRANLRGLDLRGAIVAVLDDCDLSFLYGLGAFQSRRSVKLHGILLGIGTYGIYCIVQQIPLTGSDLLHRPARTTGVIICCKAAIAVRGVGVNQGAVLVDTINSACQRSVALGSAGLAVHLG